LGRVGGRVVEGFAYFDAFVIRFGFIKDTVFVLDNLFKKRGFNILLEEQITFVVPVGSATLSHIIVAFGEVKACVVFRAVHVFTGETALNGV
jgi:hypothetical protein